MSEQNDLKAKPVRYNGIPMRSKTEGKWARFFDLMRVPYEYELHSYNGYLPDFLIKQSPLDENPLYEIPVYFEAKGRVDDCCLAKLRAFSSGGNTVILSQGFPMDYHGYEVVFSQTGYCYSDYFSDFSGGLIEDAKMVVVDVGKGFVYMPNDYNRQIDIISSMTKAFDEANAYPFEELTEEEYNASIAQYLRNKKDEDMNAPIENKQPTEEEKGAVIRDFRKNKQNLTMRGFWVKYINTTAPEGTMTSTMTSVEKGVNIKRYNTLRNTLYEKITRGELEPIKSTDPEPKKEEKTQKKATDEERNSKGVAKSDEFLETLDSIYVLMSILDCSKEDILAIALLELVKANKPLIDSVIAIREKSYGRA